MPKGMSANSVISDAEPFEIPETPKPKTKQENDFAKLGKSNKYPAVAAYIDQRIEFFRRYLPDGTAIQNVADEHVAAWWKCSASIISELETLKNTIEVHAGKKK